MISRRRFVCRLGAAASLPLLRAARAGAQATDVLPVNTPRIDHLDVMVPDVEASTRFYTGMFRTALHAQPFQGGVRYFVLLGELPANRQVGYLAIGDARGRGTYIGHFCTSVFDYRRDSAAIASALADAVERAGLGVIGEPRIGGIFADPDGIEIQFLPAPDTLVTAAVPSDLIEPNQGLVTPQGVDHVLLHVADLDRATRFYRILYGTEADRTQSPARVWFQIGETRLGLEQAASGRPPHIEHFAIKVAAFDADAVRARLAALGATVVPSPDEPEVLRVRDPDGITFELTAGGR